MSANAKIQATANPPIGQAMRAGADVPAPINGNHKIFLVEDDKDHAGLVKRGTKGKAELVWEKSADSAWKKLLEMPNIKHGGLRLILLDLRLPGVMDGLDLLKKLKTSKDAQTRGLHHIPVVVLTTSDNDKDRLKAYNHHVNSYLLKPGAPDQWPKLMEDVDRYWLDWNRSTP